MIIRIISILGFLLLAGCADKFGATISSGDLILGDRRDISFAAYQRLGASLIGIGHPDSVATVFQYSSSTISLPNSDYRIYLVCKNDATTMQVIDVVVRDGRSVDLSSRCKS